MSRRRLAPILALSLLAAASARCDQRVSFGDATPDATGGDARDGTVTDASGDGDDVVSARCAPGVDTDRDGVPNDRECELGTDPSSTDSDMDGATDGAELRYPRVCVGVSVAQRRPPVACMDTSMCNAGEECRGLDPLVADSDMDGIPDGGEDRDLNGTVDVPSGETDPRLRDTIGDGLADGMRLAVCRPEGLAMVTQVDLPASPIQLAHDTAWGTSTPVTGTMGRNARLLDDAASNVAGAVISLPAEGDVRMEAMRIEALITAAMGTGITPVFVGRSLTTHERQPAVTSVYRVGQMTSASALRDAAIMPLIGAAAPASPTPIGASSELVLEVTTVRRMGGMATNRTDVVFAVAPRSDLEDVMRPTAIRVNDLVNTTGVAEAGRILGAQCQTFRAAGPPQVDFIWTVDTSGSIYSAQERIGRTATQFFNGLRATGVDFRVGVFESGSRTLNLDSPGFTWVSGADPMGPQRLCESVTVMACPTSPGDTRRPYAFPGGGEEPVAAGVVAHYELFRRLSTGEPNEERRLRPGARVVAFFVTDEPLTETGTEQNDWVNYFRSSMDPQGAGPWGSVYSDTTLGNIIAYFRRNRMLTFGLVPVYPRRLCSDQDPRDLPRCVVEGNGGATIPIGTATDAEVSAAVARIVAAVAGSTTQFQLGRSPITSTIKVTVGGMTVPRSRSEGFDYDPASRSVVFYGTRYRPARDAQVVISYRVWEGSLG